MKTKRSKKNGARKRNGGSGADLLVKVLLAGLGLSLGVGLSIGALVLLTKATPSSGARTAILYGGGALLALGGAGLGVVSFVSERGPVAWLTSTTMFSMGLSLANAGRAFNAADAIRASLPAPAPRPALAA